jgi:hypothetical protein
MFALPLAIISNNFGEYEKLKQRREKIINSLRAENNNQCHSKIRKINEKDI